ncbi:MAG: efflux RND transporter periplasmic adaptor subunit [Bacteroidia bacterium]|nr:efflux RND transporter periplasmic adaptor subunit [Bacteroidia bacterium]
MKRIILSACFLLFLPGGCRNDTVPAPKTETTRVRVVSIIPEDVSISVHSSGILTSEEEIKLSFKTGGIVATINVKEGDNVKKGDIIAALNLAEINANVDMARNGYEKARRDWTRAKSLYGDTVATLEQFQNATTALNVAKSNLEIAGFNLLHSTIKAPGDGIVLRQLVKQNELVPAGYPVFLFGTRGKFWKVRSSISDRDIVRINPGDSADVVIDAYPGVKFPAVVDQVSGISNPMTGTFETELSLDGMGHRLASGFIAGVDIFPSGKKVYVMLPVGAIVEADGQTGYIYSVTDSGTVVKHKIDIEAIKGDDAAVKGIPDMVRTIVTEGAAYLRDGMKIEVVK